MAIPDKPLTRQEQYLDAIAKAGGGGGSSLPAVTSDDNGKVLSVVDGAWAKDTHGHSIVLTFTSQTGGTWSSDYSFDELFAEYINGRPIIVNAPNMGSVLVSFGTSNAMGTYFVDADNSFKLLFGLLHKGGSFSIVPITT